MAMYSIIWDLIGFIVLFVEIYVAPILWKTLSTSRQGTVYSVFWTAYFYMDVLALLPQVVMMARSGGNSRGPKCCEKQIK